MILFSNLVLSFGVSKSKIPGLNAFHILPFNPLNPLAVPSFYPFAAAAAAAKSLHSCPTLCNPIDDSPPGSAIPGILQARTLEWVAISFSNESESEVAQSCPTLSDPMDCLPPIN